MSNEKLPTPVTDLKNSELVKIEKFKQDGLPGLANITDGQIKQMLDLYLGGFNYTQISQILRIKRIIVIYLAHVSDWCSMRQELLVELQEKIKSDIADAKLRSAEFLLLAIRAWQKRIGHNLSKYMATNDPEHMDNIPMKEMTLLIRAMEMLNEWDESKANSKNPAVAINLGSNLVLEKTGSDRVTITPKETTIGSLLQRYGAKSIQEVISDSTDINKKNDGENNEK